MAVAPPSRGANPFNSDGVQADAHGVRRYQQLHGSLIEMLRESVDRDPSAEALVEVGVGSERLSYQQLWEQAARVAGGLREHGINPGDRVAIRLANSIDWVRALL